MDAAHQGRADPEPSRRLRLRPAAEVDLPEYDPLALRKSGQQVGHLDGEAGVLGGRDAGQRPVVHDAGPDGGSAGAPRQLRPQSVPHGPLRAALAPRHRRRSAGGGPRPEGAEGRESRLLPQIVREVTGDPDAPRVDLRDHYGRADALWDARRGSGCPRPARRGAAPRLRRARCRPRDPLRKAGVVGSNPTAGSMEQARIRAPCAFRARRRMPAGIPSAPLRMGRRSRSRGTIGPRKGRPGYWIRYRDERGIRRMTRGGDTLAEAELRLRLLIERVDDLRSGRIRAITLAEFLADELLPLLAGRLAPKSYESFRGRALRAARHFGARLVSDVTRAEAADYLGSIRAAPLTIVAHRAALSSTWRHAIERRAATVNPWLGLPVPRAQQRAVPYLTEEQLGTLYLRTPPSIRRIVVLLGETGLRRGEALELRWEHVAADLSSLTVARSKSGRVRTVPLTARAREALAGIRRRSPETRVFRAVGASWPKTARAAWRRAKRRAGLPVTMRLHDLRHCRAALLVRAGVPAPTVARWLGHSSAVLVLTRYGVHAPADELRQALAALERGRGS